MVDATERLRALAQRVVNAAVEHARLRAALLAGSAGRGDADFYSDIDLLLYVDDLPTKETLAKIRAAAGAASGVLKGESEHAVGEEFDLQGVRTEATFFTVARIEWRVDQLNAHPEAIDQFVQKAFLGILEGLPLYGADVVARWQSRLRDYPDSLRRFQIERHWRFFPLWYHGDAIARRDAELWRLDALLEAAFNLLAVLAALNRLYFARFELKRVRALVAKMVIAPTDLADRLESLFRLEPERAAVELGRLVVETRSLVQSELADLELPLDLPPGTRQRPWTVRPAERP